MRCWISKLSEHQKQEVVSRASNGESLTAIAQEHGVTRQAIRGILRRRGVPARTVGKLTVEQRSELAQEYLRGATLAQISARYGISDASVRSLVTRRGVPLRRRFIPSVRRHSMTSPPTPATGSGFCSQMAPFSIEKDTSLSSPSGWPSGTAINS
ncbi:helix-turn-helix domain-containing protein [Micromonospora rosaria]|uniref:helix-turn-helix domain-containing protein n=1 Tax=Micromonospora rosaria TaxID=47874 RepID=UPI0012FA28EA